MIKCIYLICFSTIFLLDFPLQASPLISQPIQKPINKQSADQNSKPVRIKKTKIERHNRVLQKIQKRLENHKDLLFWISLLVCGGLAGYGVSMILSGILWLQGLLVILGSIGLYFVFLLIRFFMYFKKSL
jgi:hypothetical protein